MSMGKCCVMKCHQVQLIAYKHRQNQFQTSGRRSLLPVTKVRSAKFESEIYEQHETDLLFGCARRESRRKQFTREWKSPIETYDWKSDIQHTTDVAGLREVPQISDLHRWTRVSWLHTEAFRAIVEGMQLSKTPHHHFWVGIKRSSS